MSIAATVAAQPGLRLERIGAPRGIVYPGGRADPPPTAAQSQ
jgi:hypothetical protein